MLHHMFDLKCLSLISTCNSQNLVCIILIVTVLIWNRFLWLLWYFMKQVLLLIILFFNLPIHCIPIICCFFGRMVVNALKKYAVTSKVQGKKWCRSLKFRYVCMLLHAQNYATKKLNNILLECIY